MKLCLFCTFSYVGICDTCCVKYNVCKECVIGLCEACEMDEGICVSEDYVIINQIIEDNWMYWRAGPDDEEWIDEREYSDDEEYFEGGSDL